MRAAADLLGLVARGDSEFDAPPLHLGDLRLAPHAMSHRRGGEMADGDHRADRALAGIEEGPHRVECRVLHDHDHDRSEEHTSELQSPDHLVCRLLLEKKKKESMNYSNSN